MIEEPLTGGAVNKVSRSGDIVFRSGGVWVPAVHQVLDHLSNTGWSFAPRALGIAPDGREMISFLPGDPMPRPWRPVMFTDAALIQAATMLRSLHDVTRSLELPATTIWRTGPAAKRAGQVIRHGDLGPWNTLWDGDRLTGLVDWDFAEPGDALTDLAQLALYFVPLRSEAHWQECGFPARPNFANRLGILCHAYGGVTPAAAVKEIARLQRVSAEEIESRAAQGRYPWTMFRDNGEVDRTMQELAWLHAAFPLPGERGG